MASRAYVLIEATIGKGREVATALRKMSAVKDSYLITGPYDVIAMIEGESADDINTIITTNIHNIPGIARTVTCLTIPVP